MLLVAAKPAAWPKPPPEMSYSTLGEIEECPRRWALAEGEYPSVWGGHGYPPRLSLASMPGTVVHLALEDAIAALTGAGCSSVTDPAAPAAIRDRGGYTSIVTTAIEKALSWFSSNPRAAMAREHASRSLRAQSAELRSRVQALLARVRFASVHRDPPRRSAPQLSQAPPRPTRSPITAGVFPELLVRAPSLGWKGKLDLLVVDDDACEIVDFKTGAQRPEHIAQLRTYALLWSRDPELNPGHRLATRLTISYPSVDVSVPVPSEAELRDIEADLRGRTERARVHALHPPPPARPAAETCRGCGVRHLCDDYWTDSTQRLVSSATTGGFIDAQLSIQGLHGSSSWDARVLVGPLAITGKDVVLRAAAQGFSVPNRQVVRVLDVHLSVVVDDERQPPVLTLGSFSEAFEVR